MHFHTEAFTQIRFDIYAPIHTEAFRHGLFFRITEALTQRSLYTENLLHTDFYTHELFHRSFCTHELFHRSFYTEKLLSTGAFTHRRLHRSLYTRRLRSFYTEKPLHTDAFTQKNRFHRAAFTHFNKSQLLLKFLTFGHHIVRKGCIRRWKIAIFDVGQPFCVKGLRLTL